ncbi:flagellar hook-basal body protein [Aureliella helgolandensis]|uniref:Flagellar hook protein FlgE n=1 Tax=Aureliella helgolandensis TaxID=2527968 RepID=A0A518G8Z4_9BACT|nr:flagellar hook-basal body protein [Aureliella helgolandensis]QDV25056.1 Flagellar hook protein FlgE [Aureliella helgolandensis]
MPYGLYLSAAGANAQSHRLEVLSHNLANINTAGFKPHMAMLQSQHAEAIAQGDVPPGQGGVDDVGGGIGINPTVTMFEQGPIRQTGNQTDFAINDEQSFFTVEHGGKQMLTRAGNFLFDSQGTLVTPGGDPVLSAGGGRVVIDKTRPFQAMDDGAIVQDGVRQMVGLVRPKEKGDLSRVGENLFESLTPLVPVADRDRQVTSGALEMSAVEPTKAMMELIEASRVYEANVKLMQTQDDATGQLISRVLRQG